ncbi:hypothetical protein LX36DRAFT_265477 [Colletotrichum falcatum]|nr:hypothetical protein LX36DRAFT_265477 [Colletotrichum falcatum]
MRAAAATATVGNEGPDERKRGCKCVCTVPLTTSSRASRYLGPGGGRRKRDAQWTGNRKNRALRKPHNGAVLFFFFSCSSCSSSSWCSSSSSPPPSPPLPRSLGSICKRRCGSRKSVTHALLRWLVSLPVDKNRWRPDSSTQQRSKGGGVPASSLGQGRPDEDLPERSVPCLPRTSIWNHCCSTDIGSERTEETLDNVFHLGDLAVHDASDASVAITCRRRLWWFWRCLFLALTECYLCNRRSCRRPWTDLHFVRL